MLRILAACALACAIVTTPAEAKKRSALHPDCNVTMPCVEIKTFKAEVRGPLQPQMFTRKKERQARAAPQSWGGLGAMTVSPARVAGLVPELAAKVAEILRDCPGTKFLGGVSHRRIAGTRRMSLHATGQAADIGGNPGCQYGKLASWPGGYTTDHDTAPNIPHVHISYGGFEHGRRFAHNHYGKKRYAKRHRHRNSYASAGER